MNFKNICHLFLFTVVVHSAFNIFQSSNAFAHTEHEALAPVDANQLSQSAVVQPPPQLGFSSIQLLEKDITLEGGYGRGWYFETPSNDVEKMVNQGFAMLNMFQYTDGFRSFNTALKMDSSLTIAQIGRALNAMNLDPNDQFYLVEAYQHIMSANSSGLLDEKTKAWSNMFLALITGKDVNGQSLDVDSAYSALKQADPNNFEVYTTINWITNIHDINDYTATLQKDPQNVGALHYLMHLAESQNDHAGALKYGQLMVPLTPRSAHGQHMLGHVMPHFKRWDEAEKQFQIAHQLHLDWAKQNKVSPAEDWHYVHNLTLMSVTHMVYDPPSTLSVLEEIETINPGAVIDTLDYLVATIDLGQKSDLDNYFKQIEGFFRDYKNYVASSRLFYDLVFNKDDVSVIPNIISKINSGSNFKNKSFLRNSVALIQAGNDAARKKQILDQLTLVLDANFSRGGFDGWQQSVLETLMYKKVFEVYGIPDGLSQLQTKVIDVYMSTGKK